MSIGFPKPPAEIVDRVQEKREAEAKARAFRLAVWIRDGAKCRHCGRKVIKTIDVVLCLLHHKDPAVIAKFRR